MAETFRKHEENLRQEFEEMRAKILEIATVELHIEIITSELVEEEYNSSVVSILGRLSKQDGVYFVNYGADELVSNYKQTIKYLKTSL